MNYRDYRKKYGEAGGRTDATGQARAAGRAAGLQGKSANATQGRSAAARPAQPGAAAPRKNAQRSAAGDALGQGNRNIGVSGVETPTGGITRHYTKVGTKKNTNKSSRNSASAKIVLTAIISLTVFLILMTVLLAVTGGSMWVPDCLAGKVNLEAGRKSLKASDFLIDKTHTAEFVDENDFSLNHVGVYRVRVRIDGGKAYSVRLQVKDTVPPKAVPAAVTVRQGSTPDPSLCVTDISDATSVKVSYRVKTDFSELGSYPVTVILTDEGGNETAVESTVHVVEDAAVLNYSITVEAGTPVPEVTAFIGADGVGEYYSDISTIDTSVPGIYSPEIISRGQRYSVQIVVADTVAPTGTVQPLMIYNDGDFPPAERFFTAISDKTEVTASYYETPVKTGAYPVTVRLALTDRGGNVTLFDSYVTNSTDYTAPVITVLSDTIDFTVGDTAMVWRSNLLVSDNSGETPSLSLDLSHADTGVPGVYDVYYVAVDAAGNETRKAAKLTVHDNLVTDEMLESAVRSLCNKLFTANMTSIAKLKALYNYLTANTNDKVHYANDSPHDDWRREAYAGLATRKTGDCFTFASIGQAVFRYLGYDTVIVQRAEGASPGHGTHFWIMVNLGNDSSPSWYHFDGTPMSGKVRDLAYAMTTDQLNAYTRWRNEKLNDNTENYYVFDESKYPTSATKRIMEFQNVPASYVKK